jgi:alanine racemase
MAITEPEISDPAAARAGALLTIDLGAIAANYRRLCRELGAVASAAVVKADAYGLGVDRVAPALAAAGARSFFVAQLNEAIDLRAILGAEPHIFVLNGLAVGAERDYLGHDLMPVLNSLTEVEAWRNLCHSQSRRLAAALHVDTGMNRLGLPADELDRLAEEPARLEGLDLVLVMSHLACAEEPEHPLNGEQLAAFRAARARLPPAPASLANSSGIFLGPAYHFDLARPGVALYGVNPTPGRANPMSQVVRLQGKILQIRDVDAPRSVGYGATYRLAGPTRLATVAVGYADGYLRALSNHGSAFIEGKKVAVVGRVSMDLITLDISAAPREAARPGTLVDLLGPDHDLDALAREAGTIGYELLTSLGRRYHRDYRGG